MNFCKLTTPVEPHAAANVVALIGTKCHVGRHVAALPGNRRTRIGIPLTIA